MSDNIYTANLYHYTKLTLYNKRKYDNVFMRNHMSGDELAIKDPDTEEFNYYRILKKDDINYLLPSHWKGDLPLKCLDSIKIPFKNKGYRVIIDIESVALKSKRVFDYDVYIDNYLPYRHENPSEWTVWKIATDVAYRTRTNTRAISYPGWGKDSPLVVKSLLRNDVASANKPSYPKLKWMLSAKNKIVGLNEIQDIKSDEKRHLAMFYEAVGAYEPSVLFDKRATGGTEEGVDLEGISSMTFYNIPKLANDRIFDDPSLFHPKVIGRIFPMFLTGGTHDITAMKEEFSEHITHITDEEYDALNDIVMTDKYYEDNWYEELKNSGKIAWTLQHKFGNNRLQRNYVTMCNGLKMYAKTIEQFHELENVLFNMNKNYKDWMHGYLGTVPVINEAQDKLLV